MAIALSACLAALVAGVVLMRQRGPDAAHSATRENIGFALAIGGAAGLAFAGLAALADALA